jgi:hypothetical protein
MLKLRRTEARQDQFPIELAKTAKSLVFKAQPSRVAPASDVSKPLESRSMGRRSPFYRR